MTESTVPKVRIFTPIHATLDIASTAWLISQCLSVAGEEYEIVHVTSDWTGSDMTEDDYSVGLRAQNADLGHPIRYGKSDQDDKFNSCFGRASQVLQKEFGDSQEDVNFIISSSSALKKYINATSFRGGAWSGNCMKCSSHDISRHFNPHLVDFTFLFDSIRGYYASSQAESSPADVAAEVYDMWFEILDAMLHKHTSSRIAKSMSNNAKIETIGSTTIAIAEGDQTIKSSEIVKSLFGRGVSVVVYKQGNNIGVIRNKDADHLDLRGLKMHIQEDGWSFSESGVMASRGTESLNASTPSRYTTAGLVDVVCKFIASSQPVKA